MVNKNLLSSLIIFLLSGLSFGCYSHTPIELQDGVTVDNCRDYNEAREKSRVKEQGRNFLIASEYLDCSLLSGVEPITRQKSILKLINEKLRVRSIPTSLGMSVGRKDTFEKAGATLNFDKQALEVVNAERNFKIILKGKMNGKVLIWVIDEIPQGTYRSYYPALLSISEEKQSVSAFPFYDSGF